MNFQLYANDINQINIPSENEKFKQHHIYINYFLDTTSQNGDFNVLLNVWLLSG